MRIDESLRTNKSADLSGGFDCDHSMVVDGQRETWPIDAGIITENAVPAWDVQIADAFFLRPQECVIIAVGNFRPADDLALDVDVVGMHLIDAERAQIINRVNRIEKTAW